MYSRKRCGPAKLASATSTSHTLVMATIIPAAPVSDAFTSPISSFSVVSTSVAPASLTADKYSHILITLANQKVPAVGIVAKSAVSIAILLGAS